MCGSCNSVAVQTVQLKPASSASFPAIPQLSLGLNITQIYLALRSKVVFYLHNAIFSPDFRLLLTQTDSRVASADDMLHFDGTSWQNGIPFVLVPIREPVF